MNPDPNYERLREIGWRRQLTEAERVELRRWLAAHPEYQTDTDAEAQLTQLMAKLPDAPLSSNFTARVLEAVEREEQTTGRFAYSPRRLWWRRLMPRLGIATLVVAVSGISYWRYQVVKQAELAQAAQNLAKVPGAEQLSDPLVFENFDVIRQMSQADDGLLALSDDLLSLNQ